MPSGFSSIFGIKWLFWSIKSFSRNFMTYAASEIRNVMDSSGDKVNMAMEDSLSCTLTNIYSMKAVTEASSSRTLGYPH